MVIAYSIITFEQAKDGNQFARRTISKSCDKKKVIFDTSFIIGMQKQWYLDLLITFSKLKMKFFVGSKYSVTLHSLIIGQKIPKGSKICWKISKDSEKFWKITKDYKIFWKIPEDSKDSKRFKKTARVCRRPAAENSADQGSTIGTMSYCDWIIGIHF